MNPRRPSLVPYGVFAYTIHLQEMTFKTITPDQEETFRKALAMWGKHAQLNKAKEECAELIVAISHHECRGQSVLNIIEEMADVSIMIDQLIIMLGVESGFEFIRLQKIERLRKKLLELEGGSDVGT